MYQACNDPSKLKGNKTIEKNIDPKWLMLRDNLEISNRLNGIEILNKKLDLIDKHYTLELILETYRNDSLMASQTLFKGKNFHALDSTRTKFVNQIILALKRENDHDDSFKFIFGNNINKITRIISLDSNYIRPYGLKDFKIFETQDIMTNQVIPFALYGAFWEFEFNGEKALRFCSTDEKLQSRTDKQIYGKSPSYYIFGYKLTPLKL